MTTKKTAENRPKKGRDIYDVYLASPFFTEEQRKIRDELSDTLEKQNLKVFNPERDAGMCDGYNNVDVFHRDLQGIRNSRVVVANIIGNDPGTIFEIGFANCLGKPVFALTPVEHLSPAKFGQEYGNMILQSCILFHNIPRIAELLSKER